jgi:hypothetical protein
LHHTDNIKNFHLGSLFGIKDISLIPAASFISSSNSSLVFTVFFTVLFVSIFFGAILLLWVELPSKNS